MERLKKILFFVAFLVGIYSCSTPNESIANIKEAAKNENCTYVSAQKYADQAQKEGLKKVELLFKAFAKSQLIHKNMLIDLIEKKDHSFVESDEKCQCQVDSTIVNLHRMLANTQYDFYNLYPEFVEKAQNEGYRKAVKRLEAIMEVNMGEIAIFESTIDSVIKYNSDEVLPDVWSVCNACGNVTKGMKTKSDKCKLCGEKGFSQFSI